MGQGRNIITYLDNIPCSRPVTSLIKQAITICFVDTVHSTLDHLTFLSDTASSA